MIGHEQHAPKTTRRTRGVSPLSAAEVAAQAKLEALPSLEEQIASGSQSPLEVNDGHHETGVAAETAPEAEKHASGNFENVTGETEAKVDYAKAEEVEDSACAERHRQIS